MKSSTYEAVPIYPADGSQQPYLEMTREGDRFKVMATALGKDKLDGRLWPYWLLLTKSSPKLTYGVGIVGKYVLVSSTGSFQEMIYTVSALAAQILPVQKVLVLEDEESPRGGVVWHVRDYGRRMPMVLLVKHLPLPAGASVSFNPNFSGTYWELRLHRKQSCRTPLRELSLIVELYFAQSCAYRA